MPGLGLSEGVQKDAMAKLDELKAILAAEDVDVMDFVKNYSEGDADMGESMGEEEMEGESGGSPKKALIIAMLKAKQPKG